MTDVDLLVIGGGPVGLVTAIEARRAGLSVLVAEPRSAPVDKACGEGLMPSAREALAALGVAPTGRPFTGITYIDEQGRQADADFRGGPGLGVRRLVLHEALAKELADSGAETASVPARLLSARPTHVDVEVGNRCIRASFVAGADGLHSAVRRDLGLNVASQRVRRFGLRQHWQVAPWSDHVEVYWGRGAELYVTPVADDMIGVAVLTSIRGRSMADWLSAFPTLRQRLGDAPACSTARGAGPLAQRARRRTAGRVLLVGDASGYVDAITGEGLAVGFPMAAAAVAAVLAEDPQQYERDWRRITRRSRLLTRALLAASQNPAVRGHLVGSAARLPSAFRAAVAALA